MDHNPNQQLPCAVSSRTLQVKKMTGLTTESVLRRLLVKYLMLVVTLRSDRSILLLYSLPALGIS